ncbi:MAG: hypothetical protein OXE78_14050 [Gammaproteobacteria bacterium]|nr:hypothetical protein [Gammaproteobacteria bacterium]
MSLGESIVKSCEALIQIRTLLCILNSGESGIYRLINEDKAESK